MREFSMASALTNFNKRLFPADSILSFVLLEKVYFAAVFLPS